MVSCPNKPLPSPRSALGPPLASRGVVKHSILSNKFKKVQRALGTVFEESAGRSPAFFSSTASPGGGVAHKQQRRQGLLLPALSRLRAQESRVTPGLRRATPIKDAGHSLRAAWGRHRLGAALQRDAADDLAAELGAACQLQSGLKVKATQKGGSLALRLAAAAADAEAGVAGSGRGGESGMAEGSVQEQQQLGTWLGQYRQCAGQEQQRPAGGLGLGVEPVPMEMLA